MAIGDFVSNNSYSRMRQYTTIYDDDMKVIRLGKKNFTLIDSIRRNVTYTPWKIPMECEFRPDKISNNFYGTPYLYWIIMGYNFMWHVKDFSANTTIKIPNESELIAALT